MFSATIEDGRPELWAYDTGRRLVLEDVDEGVEVNFCVDGMKDTITNVTVSEGGKILVGIPDAVLAKNKSPLRFWIYARDSKGKKTQQSFAMPVKTRVKPAGYNGDPESGKTWDQLWELVQLASKIYPNAGGHNSFYRGEFIGKSVTPAQYSAISAGTFDDLYIGDYWTIGDVNYRVAAFDYFLHTGDIKCTKHHVVVVPDTNMYIHVMNDTDTTGGAYVGSKMYTEGLEQAKTMIKAAFSGHVLSHRIYLNNAVSNGKASDGTWYDSEVDLMCEHMVYGNGVFSPVSDGTTVPGNFRVEKSQLPLFRHDPSRICNRTSWWLRDVISSSNFASVANHGSSNYSYASYSGGVRPYACIYGGD